MWDKPHILFQKNKWSYLTIFYGVLDSTQTIPDSVFDLCEGVFVGSLHQKSDWARVPTLLNERVLLLSLKTGLGEINIFNMNNSNRFHEYTEKKCEVLVSHWKIKAYTQKNTHQCVLVDQPSMSQTLRCEVINWIHGNATASEGEPAKGTTCCMNMSVLWCHFVEH